MTGNKPDTAHEHYFVIHGHFYQPPRENPWLDAIERQPSAAPYHDWNERIYSECYRPNAFSRLLDSAGMIAGIHNNYENLSFNFGPTLFSWLETKHPKIAQKIIEADAASAARLNGHGNAIAQVFNHLIMPLASRRDQLTQIRWAKSFFKARFKREPEGIWLAETAINMLTVSCLIEENIRFVILGPQQADQVRKIGDEKWLPVDNGSIDPRRPYRLYNRNPDGSQSRGYVDVFFFDEGLSRAVSFENLLTDAHILGERIDRCFDKPAAEQQMVTIATDGETFGHHKPLSDMCLSYLFTTHAPQTGLVPVNFGYYLEKFPPLWEVTVKNAFGEGSAWSCAHGTGRWSRDCGCETGGQQGWNQRWRTPLRAAFNALQARADAVYEQELAPVFPDPWLVRDAYIKIADDPSIDAARDLFISCGARHSLDDLTVMRLRRLLAAQKFMLFSYTSCGWFFSDITGIETVQNILFAARALQLGLPANARQEALDEFMNILEKAESNFRGKNGKTIFLSAAAPFMPSLEIMTFTAVAEKTISQKKDASFKYFNYDISLSAGAPNPPAAKQNGFAFYNASIVNRLSGEAADFAIMLSTESKNSPEAYLRGGHASQTIPRETPAAWKQRDDVQKIALSQLFGETKGVIASYFLDTFAQDTFTRYEQWITRNEDMLNALSHLSTPLPPYLIAPIQYVLTAQWNDVCALLKTDKGHEETVYNSLHALWKKAENFNITIDYSKSLVLLETLLIDEMEHFSKALDMSFCVRISSLLSIIDRFSLPLSKNKIEDIFHTILTVDIRKIYQEYRTTQHASPEKMLFLSQIITFARRMNFNTDGFEIQ